MHTHRRSSSRKSFNTARLRIVTAVFFILGISLVTRLFHLQVLHNNGAEAQASSTRPVSQTIAPERGEIFVHDGANSTYIVATNSLRYSVIADPRLVKDPTATANQLAAVLGKDTLAQDQLQDKLSRHDDPYEVVARFVDESSATAVRRLALPGISLIKETVRYYPDGPLFSHLTGFVAFKSDGEPGQYGLEGELDGVLRGSAGHLVARQDQAGRLIATANPAFERAEPGSSVILTIDRATQFIVCKKLAAAVEKYQAASGTVVVMNPKTGDILAMCNAPSFDPNTYNDVTDASVFSNQALSAYEPGSVFKPFTMAAAIDAGVVSPQTTYTDTGAVTIGKYTIRNYGDRTYGVQSMINVLEKSLNTGAIFAARALGQNLFSQYVYRFGLGKPTGVPLAGESGGDVSNVDRKGDIYLATNSFGQGVTVTPLQLAAAFSAIANGGILREPRLISAIKRPNGELVPVETKTVRRVITEDTSRIVRAMLISVVRNGFSHAAHITGYDIGGKTGTAQVPDGHGGYNAADTNQTFAAIIAGDEPSLVMILKLERPQKGNEASLTVAPLFKDIAGQLLDLYAIPRQTK